jgi:hypothetical protein
LYGRSLAHRSRFSDTSLRVDSHTLHRNTVVAHVPMLASSCRLSLASCGRRGRNRTVNVVRIVVTDSLLDIVLVIAIIVILELVVFLHAFR